MFRPATNADLPVIRRFVEECLAEFDLCSDYDHADDDLVDLERSYSGANGVFLLAFDGEELIGTVGLFNVGPCEMKLRKMYVAASARGRGLGRKLFDAALREATERGAKSIVLETMDSMTAAIAMYEGAGFKQVPGVIKSPRCQRLYRKVLAGR